MAPLPYRSSGPGTASTKGRRTGRTSPARALPSPHLTKPLPLQTGSPNPKEPASHQQTADGSPLHGRNVVWSRSHAAYLRPNSSFCPRPSRKGRPAPGQRWKGETWRVSNPPDRPDTFPARQPCRPAGQRPTARHAARGPPRPASRSPRHQPTGPSGWARRSCHRMHGVSPAQDGALGRATKNVVVSILRTSRVRRRRSSLHQTAWRYSGLPEASSPPGGSCRAWAPDGPPFEVRKIRCPSEACRIHRVGPGNRDASALGQCAVPAAQEEPGTARRSCQPSFRWRKTSQ